MDGRWIIVTALGIYSFNSVTRMQARPRILGGLRARTAAEFCWRPSTDHDTIARMAERSAKRRILFVDDDPMLLQFYCAIMEREKEAWETHTIDDPRKVLGLLASKTFDVLVSDFRMPAMDGIQLMREVSERHPAVARMMVSGMQDQQEVARCLGLTHQFLPKPFNLKSFRATLARVCQLGVFLEDPRLQAIVAQVKSLPSVPSLYLEMMTEINREDSSLEALAAIVAKDPSMTAKLLQIVNSAAFGQARRISSPLEAIQFLGVARVNSLVLSTHIFSSFDQATVKGSSIQALWDHAFQTASLARLILDAEGAESEMAEAGYTAGLLHDIGKLILAQSFPQDWQRVLAACAEGSRPSVDVEMEIFGASHTGIGAYLLGLWGLPAPIVEAVAFHHAPMQSGTPAMSPLLAVHAANLLIHEKPESANPSLGFDRAYLAAAGVPDHLEKWQSLRMKLR